MSSRNYTGRFIEMRGGGSGTGMSHYKTAALCGRRAHLDQVSPKTVLPTESQAIGIATHKLLEQFYGDGFSPEGELVSSIPELQKHVDTAQELVRQYLVQFPEQDFWGTPIGVEVQFPANEKETKLLQQLSPHPITARMDLVTNISASQLTRLNQRTNLLIPEPGVYIIDHKTSSRRDEADWVNFQADTQFDAYPFIWNTCRAELCKGMIANKIIVHKSRGQVSLRHESFVHVFRPTGRQQLLNQLLVDITKAAKKVEDREMNIFVCKINGVCPHLLSGICTREQETQTTKEQ